MNWKKVLAAFFLVDLVQFAIFGLVVGIIQVELVRVCVLIGAGVYVSITIWGWAVDTVFGDGVAPVKRRKRRFARTTRKA